MEKIESHKPSKKPIDIPNGLEEIPGMEKLPKNHFELIDLDRETELFYSFMKRGRFSFVFDRVYPELRAIQNESKSKDECLKRYKEFLENLQTAQKEKMSAAKEEIEFEWNKIGEDFLKTLSDHFETKWSDDKPDIVGYI
jgi:hypothetical protein